MMLSAPLSINSWSAAAARALISVLLGDVVPMITLSAAVGTAPGVQLPFVFQSEDTEPFQTAWAFAL